MNTHILGLLLASCVLASAGQVAFRLGAADRAALSDFFNGWIFLGAVCYAVGTALWIYSLSKAKLTVVYPFTALTFVLVYLASAFLLREETSTVQYLGVALVLVGLYLASTG